jgi:hypothetical protein
VLKNFGAPLEIFGAPSNSLTGQPIRAPGSEFPWLSLRKEDGYGDTRLCTPVSFKLPEALKPRSIPINAGTFVQLGSRPKAGTSATVEQQSGDRITA